MKNLDKDIRLGYRLQNGSVQRNSRVKSFANSEITLDIALQAAERNINDTKDIILWNADKLRVFEISDQMIPLQNKKPQILFTRELTAQITQLHIWVKEFKQRIVVQTRPISCPTTPQQAKELIDYLTSLAYIVRLLSDDALVLVNIGFLDKNLVKFLKHLDRETRNKLAIFVDGNFEKEPDLIADLIMAGRECSMQLVPNITKILKFYEDRVVDFDPFEWWVKKADLLYMNSTNADGMITYTEYSKVRKQIYHVKEKYDIILDTFMRETMCLALMREVQINKPFWKHISDRNYY